MRIRAHATHAVHVAQATAVACVATVTLAATPGGALAAAAPRAATPPVVAASAVPAASAAAATKADLATRLAGATRYDTAAAIAAQYAPGVPAVYIATGTAFPDALAAGAAAGGASPVLLVAGATVPDAVTAQVRRLAPAQVILVGGANAVPDSVGKALGALATDGWTRLAGADRFATAAAISAATFSPGVPVVYIATGLDFPDALTGAALGARDGAPVLLTAADTLPAATIAELQRLRPAKIVMLNSENAISSAVYTQLGAYGASVTQVARVNRYNTNAAANAAAPENATTATATTTTLIVATGSNFPDALAGAALAGHIGTAMMLVGPGALEADQLDFLASFAPKKLIVLGGPNSVSDDTVTNLLVKAGLEQAPSTTDATDYVVDYADNGEVVRWNPCQTIGWKLNPGTADSATIAMITTAVANVSSATGLTFRYDGTTTYIPTNENWDVQPDDLVIAWLPMSSTDMIDDVGTLGLGGYNTWADPPQEIASGVVYLVSDNLANDSAADRHATVLHELGHAVGLEHAKYETEIMYPESVDDVPPGYSASDLAGLAKVGAAGGCIT